MSRILQPIAVMTRLTIREAQRRRMLWLGLGLGLTFVAMFATGYYFAYQDFLKHRTAVTAFDADFQIFGGMFLSAGLYVVSFLVVMITALTTVGAISGEVDSNTIHAIAAKPVRRWQIVLGKWLGYAGMMAVYTTLLATGVMLATYLVSGFTVSRPLAIIGVLFLECLTILSLSLLGSSMLSTLANGVVVFMLYGLAFVGSWMEQFGTLLQSQTAVDIGILSSLLVPSEALWRLAAGLIDIPGVSFMPASPFMAISAPSPAMLVYGVIYMLALLGAAIAVFSRRDF